jgi:cathepsin F
MLALLVLTCVVALASANEILSVDDKKSFDSWKIEHNKRYGSVQAELRAFDVWIENRKIINNINGQHGLSWKAGLNQFSDLTQDEFRATFLMTLTNANATLPITGRKPHPKSGSNPNSFDWRSDGSKQVVTSVKNQGSVGSCWAFSTIENVEGQWALAGNPLTELSPEFLVDCDGSVDGNHADCSVFGGWPYLAYQFIIKSGGVPSEQSWPYCAGNGDCYPCMQGPVAQCGPPPSYCDKSYSSKCDSKPYDVTAKISSWTTVSDDETEIASELYARGPLSVLLDASYLQYYKSGVWDGHLPGSPSVMKCTKTSLNHAVLLVGYGVTAADDASSPSTPYWSVKNSWGTKWGEDGYFRISRGVGQCGINTAVTTSIV